MPSRPIPKGFVGPALMAHILRCKYGYHLPLYRQSQMFAKEGIDLSGALMAGWVGKCTELLECVSDVIRDLCLRRRPSSCPLGRSLRNRLSGNR